jgi:ABC-type nitrate/sulfonate/bicarbonate transport system permease component
MIATFGKSAIIEAQGGGAHGYLPQIASTFWHVSAGLTAGILLGLSAAMLCFGNPITRRILGDATEFGRTIPPLLLIPFCSIVFGVSDWVQIIGVALYSGLIMCMYCLGALEALPDNYLQMAALLGARPVRRICTVQLPGILPAILGAVRVAASYGLGISIVAEYLASPTGIGRVMKYSMAYSNVELIVVGVLWTAALSFLFDLIIVVLLSASLKWTRRADLVRWLTT